MKSLKGEEAFDQYFSEVYSQRWGKLKQALLEEEVKVGRINSFYQDKIEVLPGIGELCEDVNNCYQLNDDFDLNQFDSLLLPVYRMDPASIYPAKALQVEPGQVVLDMCAAPGGKSLVLIEDLFSKSDSQGLFIANELSARRRHRMMSVFKRYLPQEIRSQIKIRGVDACAFGLEKKDFYDRILLDAPCSGERGVLQKKIRS